jgi:glycosyltransferase involved in cell wall biosynthesis
MISVVIATHNDEPVIGQTLAALVHAAVDGLVREVILADAGSTDDTLEVADDAGCHVVQGDGPPEARIAEACKTARANWLLILEQPLPPPSAWMKAAAEHINSHSAQAVWWGPRALWPMTGKADAILVPRKLYDQVGGYGPDFLKTLGRKAKPLKLNRAL